MASAADFSKFVPGFDFLQGLLRSAGNVLPDMGKWVAPTMDPEELGQRIEQLKTVQVWLEQNARMLGATVQALEVQRMTLATLKSMNVQVADLGQALRARTTGPQDPAPGAAPGASQAARSGAAFAPAAPATTAAPARRRARTAPGKPRSAEGSGAAGGEAPPAMVDPMQWWGALTQQFTQLAAQAVKDGPVEAARSAAGQFAQATARVAKSPVTAPGTGQATARKPAAKPRTPTRAPRAKQT